MRRSTILVTCAILAGFAGWFKLRQGHPNVETSGPSAPQPPITQIDGGWANASSGNTSGTVGTKWFGSASRREPVTGAEKLRAEYTMIVTGRPILTNLYDSLALLSGRDPFDSDLFADACFFLSVRSSMQELMELDAKAVLPFRSRMDRYPEAERKKIEEMMGHFEQSSKDAGLSLSNALESISKIFAERFEKRHGMNGEATVNQILNLGLPPGLMVFQEMPCP